MVLIYTTIDNFAAVNSALMEQLSTHSTVVTEPLSTQRTVVTNGACALISFTSRKLPKIGFYI